MQRIDQKSPAAVKQAEQLATALVKLDKSVAKTSGKLITLQEELTAIGTD